MVPNYPGGWLLDVFCFNIDDDTRARIFLPIR